MAQQPGLAAAPDGRRVYLLDGEGQAGELRVLDTTTWQPIVHIPVPEMALLLGGNPLSLSGDGRWLLVQHFSYGQNRAWATVFDTANMQMLARNPLDALSCANAIPPIQLVGHPGHPRLYINCGGELIALNAETLAPIWRIPAPDNQPSALALALDGRTLYGLYPAGNVGCFGENPNDLVLYQWDSSSGALIRRVPLGEQVNVPQGTCGRGGRVYLSTGIRGDRVYIAWEDRLWAVSTDSWRVITTLPLPAAADGMVSSVDGRELYLLPATAGDLLVRAYGLWTVDAEHLTLLRHASDWPHLTIPLIFAVPAAQ
ncbi:MAG: hypothetical protein WCF84_10485 [Anaerolineae bacterium]